MIAVVFFRNRAVVSCEVTLGIKGEEAYTAGAGKFEIGIQKESGFTNARRADHEAMHIVAVHKRFQLLAALRAAENESLHLWQILSRAPACYIEWNCCIGFLHFF